MKTSPRSTCLCLVLFSVGAGCETNHVPPVLDAGAVVELPDAAAGNDAGSDAGTDAGCFPAAAPDASVCDPTSWTCAALEVTNDPPAPATSGLFRGHADPSLAADPSTPNRVWLGYTWPHVVVRPGPDGGTVYLAAAATHLARSDDRGQSFVLAKELYAAPTLVDPEGSGERGIESSETVSLASLTKGGVTTWYAAHLRYFLRPQTGYNPRYGTSWRVLVGAAGSPEALGDATVQAKEAVLGVTTTAPVYRPNVRLNELAHLPIQHCAMLNNPTLFAADETLYLIVECLAFVGTQLDFANTTTQVFATRPQGEPQSWTWRHVGALGTHAVAVELGSDTIQQPDVSRATDGSLVVLLTRARKDNALQVGTVGEGCVALELASLDPPRLRRDCLGRLVVRARVDGEGLGACTHDATSVTGVLPTHKTATTVWTLRVSRAHP